MAYSNSSVKFLVWLLLIYGAIVLILALYPPFRPWFGPNMGIWTLFFLYWIIKVTSQH